MLGYSSFTETVEKLTSRDDPSKWHANSSSNHSRFGLLCIAPAYQIPYPAWKLDNLQSQILSFLKTVKPLQPKLLTQSQDFCHLSFTHFIFLQVSSNTLACDAECVCAD